MTQLNGIIKKIEELREWKSLPDKYLEESGHQTRRDCWYGDFNYGIVYIAEDMVLPYLKELQRLREGE